LFIKSEYVILMGL